MAGKSGGSWKVAYADFVTAMMAFFLVMWIGAQDAKTRQSVANYFVDPSGADKKPVRSGATFDTPSQGSVPNEQKAQTGRGREPVSKAGEFGPATKMVADWIAADPKRHQEWKDKARASVEAAAASPGVRSRAAVADEVAAADLGNQLRAMFTAGSPAKANDVYQDLILHTLKDVNWKELAEDLIRH